MVQLTKEQKDKKAKEAANLQSLITSQWKEFSQTEAYKQFMDYVDMQDYFAVISAKGPVETFDGTSGEQVNFDREKAAALLQRSVGYDIVKMYVEGYVNSTT